MTFFEYMDKFLVESQVNARTQLGLEVGLKFSLSVLKEAKALSPALLESSLGYIYQALCDTTPQSLYGTDKESLLYDNTINDARDFFVELISAPNPSPKVAHLCFKIIFRLFLVRASVEDALVLMTLIHNNENLASTIDLRNEVRALPALEGSQHGVNKIEFPFNERSQFKLFNHKNNYELPNDSHAFCADADNIYHFSKDHGLMKIAIRSDITMPGLVAHVNNKDSVKEWGSKARMLFFNKRIYVRTIEDKSKPFHVVEPETLEIDKDFPEVKFAEEAACSLSKFQEEPDKEGRTLKESPFFTDGTYFYVVAQKKLTAENEDEGIFSMVVEVYNPSSNFDFVRSITLYKNKQKDLFVKEHNSLEFIMKANWHTNGKYLSLRSGRNAWFFDINDGVKVHSESATLEEIQLVHNYLLDTVYIFHGDQVSEGTLKNFKAQTTSQNDALKSAVEVYSKYKELYVGTKSAEKSENVIHSIMRKKAAKKPVQESDQPLPANSSAMVMVIILSYISEQSQEFNRELREQESKRTKEGFYVKCFKYPYATYLTAELFESLQVLIKWLSTDLVHNKKTEANIMHQYCFDFLLSVLKRNIQALNYTGITLIEILEKEGYQSFLKFYNDFIASMIENGYTRDFDESIEAESQGIWESIYQTCQHTMAEAMDLLYNDTSDILNSLKTTLNKDLSAKEAEQLSFSLRFLSKPEGIKTMLGPDNLEQFEVIQSVFESCSQICSKAQQAFVGSFDFATVPFKRIQRTLLEDAAGCFVQQFSQNLLLVHSELDQKILARKKAKKIGMSAAAKEKEVKEDQLLQEYEKFVSIVFSNLSKELIVTVTAVGNQIVNVVQQQNKEFFTEDMAKQYSNYSRHIDQYFKGLASSFVLFIQTLPEMCRGPFLISSVSNSCLEVIQALVVFLSSADAKYRRHLAGKLKEEDEDSTTEDECEQDDRFVDSLRSLAQQISWLAGSLAHELVKVKPAEGINPDQNKKEAEKERMARLLMSSRLLSGGVENRHLNTFTK